MKESWTKPAAREGWGSWWELLTSGLMPRANSTKLAMPSRSGSADSAALPPLLLEPKWDWRQPERASTRMKKVWGREVREGPPAVESSVKETVTSLMPEVPERVYDRVPEDEMEGGVEKRAAPLMTETLKERNWVMAGSPSSMPVAQWVNEGEALVPGVWPVSTPLTNEGMSLTGVTVTVAVADAVPPCSSVTV